MNLTASYIKLFTARSAMRITTEAVQILGGYGYMKEFPVERMMRDAKLQQIGGGTDEIQLMIIARTSWESGRGKRERPHGRAWIAARAKGG
jgi:alkylation response protein AidB-like acyl-CoA dehydrogenase